MKKTNTEDRNQYLDQAGRDLLRAAKATDAEVEAAIASPFLYARIRARLQESPASPFLLQSLLLFSVMRRAIALLAVLAVLAVCAYTFGGKSAVPQNPLLEQSVLVLPAEPKAPVTACSITSRSECLVSTDDVVALLVNSHERQK